MIRMLNLKGLKSKKVAVVILLLLAFGTGLASMNYSTENYGGAQFVSPDFGQEAGIQPISPLLPQPQLPDVAPMPAPAPPPAPGAVREVIREVPKEVIREVQSAVAKGAPLAVGPLIPLQQPIADDRMVISTASVGLNVTSVAQAVTDLRRIAESMGGFVTDSFIEPIPKGRVVEGGMLAKSISRASLTMKVPSEQLDKTLSQITSLGELVSYNTNSRDVTDQYTDLNARLKNAQTVLEQYKEILRTARTTQDILAVQQRIDTVQEQIETLTGQINRIQNQVTYATIAVGLIEPQVIEKPKIEEEQDVLSRLFVQPLMVALTVAEILIRGLLILIVGLLPLYPIVGVGYLAYRRYSSRQKRDN